MGLEEIRSEKDKIEALATSAGSGDKLAFVELIGVFSPYISSQASGFMLPGSEYEDLCQVGRIALYKAVCTYKIGIASFTTYARTCIKNAMISFVRKFTSESRHADRIVSLDDVDSEYSVVSPESTPEDAIIANEFVLSIQDAIHTSLSETEKKVLGYKMSGIGAAEISVLMGKDIKSVENTLFRARKKLKDYLNKNN